MKQLLKPLFMVAALSLAATVYAASVECPIDDMGMYFTGQTRVDTGKLLYEYKCPTGHVVWVVQ